MEIPHKIQEMVEQFESNRRAYRAHSYKETEVREEFINPFFEELGWDVNNERGAPPDKREVVKEYSLRSPEALADEENQTVSALVQKSDRRPDYAFFIDGSLKFFVEAKKPSQSIESDRFHAYQVRAYGWNASLPVSVLTDFEELAVYDCGYAPDASDPAETARPLYTTFDKYIERWQEIEELLHRDAVQGGSLERLTTQQRPKKGTTTVDAAFLKEISEWRELLARSIAASNPGISQRDLNYAVQMTIDRIIFLRIAEDRGTEPYQRLAGEIKGTGVYSKLCRLFRDADDRYNSGLFHFKHDKGNSDSLTLGLTIEDEPLKRIVKRLYYPDSPYKFAVMPIEILGQVYEQFLGKVIRLQPDRQVEVEDKPEVRKAGGVYYTPTYIVDYIVKHTVGALLGVRDQGSGVSLSPMKSLTPDPRPLIPADASRLRILDPACGSGSFLIGAYDYLLKWHLDWYIKDGPEKHAKGKNAVLQRVGKDDYRLTLDKRKSILLNNIYGVDIDTQAVEVTKLSLLLKVMEDETAAPRQAGFEQKRILPDLDSNIKCGNSLIGSDFYTTRQSSFIDQEEAYRVNAFDWEEGFPEIMKAGGFDAVIGNPPYIRMESFKELKDYLKANYVSHDERSDLYSYFIERGHKLLNKQGRFGMIVSNKFLRANYGKPLRDFLSQNVTIEKIIDFAGLPVFKGATVRTLVLLTKREKHDEYSTKYSPPLSSDRFAALVAGLMPIELAISDSAYELATTAFAQPIWSFAKHDAEGLLSRLQSYYQPLLAYCPGQICMGIKSGLTAAFTIDERTRKGIIDRNSAATAIIKPFLNGRDIRRYYLEPKNIYLIYTYHGVNIEEYPAIEQHLTPFKDSLERRATRQEWYELQQPQYRFAPYMDAPKIIFPDISIAPRFALDETGYYGSNTTYFIARRDLYLLGLLNSRLGFFYFVQTCAGLEGKNETYLRFFGQYLEGFPVRTIDFTNPTDKASHDQIIQLVETMLDLHKRLAAAKTPNDKTFIDRQIKATDRQIDRLVYALYGLSEEEIRIVEGET